ncbi:MAG: serine hydrolase, partial [Microthrixaceae bacterium]|nr:serine hydrolase [Microthrixaceae bacterium]
EIPAAGGTGNARSVAMVHRALACGGTVDGVRLMSAAGVERALVQQADNVDLVLGTNMRMGTGFGLMNDTVPLSPNPRACFWGGWGGSLSVIDLDARLTVSYVMNRMASNLVGDLRGALLVFAAYESLTSR